MTDQRQRATAQETQLDALNGAGPGGDPPVAEDATVVEQTEPAPLPRCWLFPILPSTEVAIALGGVLGASTRFTVSSLAGPFSPAGLPPGTLAVNLVGCLLIGAMQTLFLDLIRVRREVQLFVSVGFLGGLTTFSSVSVESVKLIQSGALLVAATYQIFSLAGGVLAALLGIVLAHGVYRTLVQWSRR